MNLKYMKVSLFEISYKKKITFSRHSNLLRCTCIAFPKQVIAFITNIVIGAFQWKNRYIYFTNNTDVSKNI